MRTAGSTRLEVARAKQRRRRLLGQTFFAVLGFALGLGLMLIPAGSNSLFFPVFGALLGWAVGIRSAVKPPAIDAWAQRHGLARSHEPLPAVTPLLLQPWGRTDFYAEGRHPAGFEGRFGAFNFVRPVRFYWNSLLKLLTRYWWPDAKGVQMLVAVTELPDESVSVAPVLLCERRYGGKLLDSVEDAAAELERVELESITLDRRYEIFTEPGQDPIWIRRLLSPALVVWLGEEVERELAFEIFEGNLCIAAPIPGFKDLDAASLDHFAELAAEVDRRVRAELAQTTVDGPAPTGPRPHLTAKARESRAWLRPDS